MVQFNINTITTREARAKLRDPNNRADGAFVGSCFATDIISGDYFVPSPRRVRTYFNDKASKKQSADSFVNSTLIRRYQEEFKPRKILPDPLYDPQKLRDINAGTKLGKGIPMSMFANSSGTRATLNHLSQADRKLVAQRLYCQVPLIEGFKANKKFNQHNLIVTEGLVKADGTESLVKGDIRELATQGRAVVYEVLNSKGQNDPWKTFELANYWKDNHMFQGLILHFDTIDPKPFTAESHQGESKYFYEDRQYHAEIIVVMPKVDSYYRGNFERKVRTDINFRTFIQNGLGFFQYK